VRVVSLTLGLPLRTRDTVLTQKPARGQISREEFVDVLLELLDLRHGPGCGGSVNRRQNCYGHRCNHDFGEHLRVSLVRLGS
jgi:hypothetical protein